MKQISILVTILFMNLFGSSQEINKNFFFLGCTSEISGYNNSFLVFKPKIHLILDESDTCKKLIIEKITVKKFQSYKHDEFTQYVELKSHTFSRLIRLFYKTFQCYSVNDNVHYWVYGIDPEKVNILNSKEKLSYLMGVLLMYGSKDNGVFTIKMGNSKNKYIFILNILKSINYTIIESSINTNKVPVIYSIQFIPDENFIKKIDTCFSNCFP